MKQTKEALRLLYKLQREVQFHSKKVSNPLDSVNLVKSSDNLDVFGDLELKEDHKLIQNGLIDDDDDAFGVFNKPTT